MMTTFINLLFIQLLVASIIDLSGFVDSVKWLVWKLFCKGIGRPENLRLKPFDCSLCMTWWCCIIYLLIAHQFTLPYIVISIMLALTAENAAGFIRLLKDLLVKIEGLIGRWIG